MSLIGKGLHAEIHPFNPSVSGIVGESRGVADLDPRDEGAGQQPQVARGLHHGLKAALVKPLRQLRQDQALKIRPEAVPATANAIVVIHGDISARHLLCEPGGWKNGGGSGWKTIAVPGTRGRTTSIYRLVTFIGKYFPYCSSKRAPYPVGCGAPRSWLHLSGSPRRGAHQHPFGATPYFSWNFLPTAAQCIPAHPGFAVLRRTMLSASTVGDVIRLHDSLQATPQHATLPAPAARLALNVLGTILAVLPAGWLGAARSALMVGTAPDQNMAVRHLLGSLGWAIPQQSATANPRIVAIGGVSMTTGAATFIQLQPQRVALPVYSINDSFFSSVRLYLRSRGSCVAGPTLWRPTLQLCGPFGSQGGTTMTLWRLSVNGIAGSGGHDLPLTPQTTVPVWLDDHTKGYCSFQDTAPCPYHNVSLGAFYMNLCL